METKSVAETSFDEAVTFFRTFLDENGESAPILWTFVEDVISRKTKRFETMFSIKLPIPVENAEFASRCFELAKARNLGVALVAYARCSAGLCCAIIMPADEEDAQSSLMSPLGVRYSVDINMPVALEVNSVLSWAMMRLLRFKYQLRNYVVYLKSKTDLQYQISESSTN